MTSLEQQRRIAAIGQETVRLKIQRISEDGSWPAGLTSFMPFTLSDPAQVEDDRLYFLAYNQATAETLAGRIASDGKHVEALPMSFTGQPLGAGLTTFMSLGSLFLVYSSTSGTLQAGAATYNQAANAVEVTTLPITPSTINTGRLAFVLPGQPSPFLLLYKTDMLTLWRIDIADGSLSLTNVASLSFGGGWTSFVPLAFENLDDSYAYFLAYKSTGEVEAGRVNTGQASPGIERVTTNVILANSSFSSNLGAGWDTFVNYVYDGHGIGHRGAWLLGYNSGAGSVTAGYLRLDTFAPSVNVYTLWQMDPWQSGYTSLMQTTLHNAPYFLSYAGAAAEAQASLPGSTGGTIGIDAAGPRPGVGDPPPPPHPGKPPKPHRNGRMY